MIKKNKPATAIVLCLLIGSLACKKEAAPAVRQGSLSAFVAVRDYLYIGTGKTLTVYSLRDPERPLQVGRAETASLIETIYPYSGNLLIGAPDGMYIYSLADPRKPALSGKFAHARACDPVVAQGNRAYVTLGICGGNAGFSVVDISNPAAPILARQYPLSWASGLDVARPWLLIARQKMGIAIYLERTTDDFVLAYEENSVHPIDIIFRQGIVIALSPTGISQFRLNAAGLERLSHFR